MMLRKIERLGEQDIDKENKLVFKMNSWCYPEILEKQSTYIQKYSEHWEIGFW